MRSYRLVCRLSILEALVQTIGWFLLSLITFGLAAPLFAYAFVRLVINNTTIEEIGDGR